MKRFESCFAFKFNLHHYNEDGELVEGNERVEVERCGLTLSNPVLKAPPSFSA
jgi:hypothetical protein